jgi:hypothetical protein
MCNHDGSDRCSTALIGAGVDVHLRNKVIWWYCQEASRYVVDVRTFYVYLTMFMVYCNVRVEGGWTALILASERGNAAAVQALLEAGAGQGLDLQAEQVSGW